MKLMQTTINLIAACFALSAFAVAILAGLAVGNSADMVLLRALMVIVASYPVGWAAGAVCAHVIHARLEAHRTAHPIPHAKEPAVARSKPDEEPIVI
jgi:cytosine/uracil/thiamine/allantoin permease